jgi:hypothetical protein
MMMWLFNLLLGERESGVFGAGLLACDPRSLGAWEPKNFVGL